MKSNVSSLRCIARRAMPCVAAIILAACGSSSGAAIPDVASGAVASIGANLSTPAVSDISNAGPKVTVTATPASVPSGGSATINWSAPAASSCTASGGWTGAEPTSGSHNTGALTQATTYTLTCTGTGGTTKQAATVPVVVASCSAANGALKLNAKLTRASGISPMLTFFDATGTTDTSLTGHTTTFQDVSYSWNFGDTGGSGTGTWAYGSNPGKNSMNTATGGVAAHLYVTNGHDTAYTATVTARDGTNTASCQLAVTAYDPSGANGYPGAATTCVSSSGTPVAGSDSCPAGANVSNQSSFVSALKTSLSGKRVLFKCGDTFTGDNVIVNGINFSVGAYGSCVGTSTKRPILSDSGSSGQVTLGSGNTVTYDGRFSDLDMEGNGRAQFAIYTGGNYDYSQITINNLKSNGNSGISIGNYRGTQWGLISTVVNGMVNKQAVFFNTSANNCVNGSTAYNCGGTPNFQNIDYLAMIGSSVDGTGAQNSGAGIETVRISACRLCVIENNTIENANNIGAVLKLHNGNASSQSTWIGQYTELNEISDNFFTGISGAQLVEIAPQNGVTDERLQNIVFERNLLYATAPGSGRLLASVQNGTFRDNVFSTAKTTGTDLSLQIARRGVEWNSTPGAPDMPSEPQYNEAFNNSCYSLSASNGCIGFSGENFHSPGNNGWAKNNLFYNPTGGTTVSNTGTGNSVSNNTANVKSNPVFINGGGSLDLLSDFMPTAMYSGAADDIPVFFDALGTPWPPTWNLGAVRP